MRICILTQSLSTNYGGLLQAYALQTILKRMGHEVWTEDRKANFSPIVSTIKTLIKRLLTLVGIAYYATDKQNKVITQYTDLFIRKYITITEPIMSNTKKVLKKYGFDAYIVGSDQVWRPCYSKYLPNYFLDFVAKEKDIKRIAYAASFGTSEWEFTKKQRLQCMALIKKFDAVSVREDSGVELCRKYLGVEAIHLLDPTMLLEKEDYIHLVESAHTPSTENKLMSYVLDQSEEKHKIILKISNTLALKPNYVMPKKSFDQVGPKKIKECIFPSVTHWIRGFMDAEYVFTDSFHGIVFSIIFNKPFIVIANKERGMVRFTSLLKMFGLEERLVHSYDDITDKLIYTPIDYRKINQIRKYEQEKSINYLREYLRMQNRLKDKNSSAY